MERAAGVKGLWCKSVGLKCFWLVERAAGVKGLWCKSVGLKCFWLKAVWCKMFLV